MKYRIVLLGIFCLVYGAVFGQGGQRIKIQTNDIDLILSTADNGRLYQVYLGAKLNNEQDLVHLSTGSKWEAYPASGAEDYFEPAFAIEHNDGNLTSILKYKNHQEERIDNNVTQTTIVLEDDVYPVSVKLYYKTYAKENIIKSWTEIVHKQKKPVYISRYASSMLYFNAKNYYLTEFGGDWAKEAQMSNQVLRFGKKVIDTKLGSRSAMFVQPFFQLGFDQPVAEDNGNVLVGTIGWTGNFQFTFEVDNNGFLRVISGINPYASRYELKANEVFRTPEFTFTLSENGAGQASRNFQSWARNYELKNGKGDRYTLLNNWEATYFNFDEPKLEALMKDAKSLGVDLFLLDDGWFGNKYPRVNDKAGLGDWDVMESKLPNGVPHLVESAKKAGVKFGIWIEPEMINPKSELFDKHPDWAITLPNREPYYFRNQLVLDLANPKVQDYVFGVVDNLMKENPEIAYMKWDCNSPITNIYSPYLKEKQSQLYIDHVRGVYNVFQKVQQTYPDLSLMLCAGGGGRCDYEALKYFTEFWCSDNTDPVERLFIQWGFSQIFPSKAMAAHVTSWNKKSSVKFRTDVAMMCKLGFDIDIKDLNAQELAFCQEAVKNYNKNKKLILDGDQYRLVSPYESNHMALMYVDDSQSSAILFAYDINPRYGEKTFPIQLKGLDPKSLYKIQEINLMPESKSSFSDNEKVFSGDYLMKVGIKAFSSGQLRSKVITLVKQ